MVDAPLESDCQARTDEAARLRSLLHQLRLNSSTSFTHCCRHCIRDRTEFPLFVIYRLFELTGFVGESSDSTLPWLTECWQDTPEPSTYPKNG